MQALDWEDDIVALSTPAGMGAIALIRLSGPKVWTKLQVVFDRPLLELEGGSLRFGRILDPENQEVIDEVMVSLFRGPRSYTGQDVVEVACHGSLFLQERLLRLFLEQGCRLAREGEFTLRAFFNGKMDLVQAEAVGDLIHAESQAAHRLALGQMRAGFSRDLAQLRQKLIEFAALIELELDFSEEDVEFATRTELETLVQQAQSKIQSLLDSFRWGNVLKNGFPVAIAGLPNAGKSTLLNALLNEEKAIVSPIAGTTRDVIEDSLFIEGFKFRFMDTAGLRQTEDLVEQIGVAKAKTKIAEAQLLLYLVDASALSSPQAWAEQVEQAQSFDKPYLILANKIDLDLPQELKILVEEQAHICLAAKTGKGLDTLSQKLVQAAKALGQNYDNQSQVLSNLRHFQALQATQEQLQAVLEHLRAASSGDLLALDLRHALRHLGELTGEIDVDRDILGTIFSKFCIGK